MLKLKTIKRKVFIYTLHFAVNKGVHSHYSIHDTTSAVNSLFFYLTTPFSLAVYFRQNCVYMVKVYKHNKGLVNCIDSLINEHVCYVQQSDVKIVMQL